MYLIDLWLLKSFAAPLTYIGVNVACFQSYGKCPIIREKLNMVFRGKTRNGAKVLRKKAGIPLGLLKLDLSLRRAKRTSLGVKFKSQKEEVYNDFVRVEVDHWVVNVNVNTKVKKELKASAIQLVDIFDNVA